MGLESVGRVEDGFGECGKVGRWVWRMWEGEKMSLVSVGRVREDKLIERDRE